MVSHVTTVAFQGIEAVPVDVQVQIVPAAPYFGIVGLPDKAVDESRDRVRAALPRSGLALPPRAHHRQPRRRADLPKEGSHYDLPIALALMAALGAMPGDQLARFRRARRTLARRHDRPGRAACCRPRSPPTPSAAA